jgi:hypothetical protein
MTKFQFIQKFNIPDIGMENLGIFGKFYSHWVNVIAICYILWSFSQFLPVWVCVYQEKSGNPAADFDTSPSFCRLKPWKQFKDWKIERLKDW